MPKSQLNVVIVMQIKQGQDFFTLSAAALLAFKTFSFIHFVLTEKYARMRCYGLN